MKFITREITSYKCTFGRFDLSTNSIVDLQTALLATKPGPKTIKEMENKMGTLVGTEEVSEILCMPIELFVEYAKSWMSEHDERPAHIKNNTTTNEFKEDITNG